MSLPGTILVLSGPTAVGKNTVGDALAALCPDLVRVTTCTTRQPRTGEVDGEDYHFLSEETFKTRIASGAFLEWAEVHGRYYGTPLDAILRELKADKVVLLIIDVDGGDAVEKLNLNALLVFIDPPTRETLEHRIRTRGTETPEQIAKRMERVDRELAAGHGYHHRVLNEVVEDCARSIAELVDRHRQALAARPAEERYPGLAKLSQQS